MSRLLVVLAWLCWATLAIADPLVPGAPPTSCTIASCPVSVLTNLGSNVATALQATLNGSGALTATTSPAFVTPALGVATATSLAVGGATLGSAVFAAAGANNAYTATIAGGSVTGSGTNGIGLNITATLNTTGVVSGAILNSLVTNTAAAVGSSLITIDDNSGFNIFRVIKGAAPVSGVWALSSQGGAAASGYSGFNFSPDNSNVFFFGRESALTGALFLGGTAGFGANKLRIGLNTNTGFTDTTLTRKAIATFQFGDVDAATSVAQTISFQGIVAGTSNTSGSTATIVGSLSTGSGTSGDIDIRTGGTGAGATVQNSSVSAIRIKGATQQANFGGIINPANGFTPTAGSGAASVAGNDQIFVVTAGTAQTSITVNFGHTWAAAPNCTISTNSTASVVDIASVSTTVITFGASVALTGALINTHCFGA